MHRFLKFIVSVIICEGIGIVGGIFTVSAIPNWYVTLHKPFFSPPNWIFAPIWTALYFLMGVAAFLVWEKGFKKQKVKIALKFFLIQLALNFFWSLFFFGLHSPLLAFIEIVILWLTIFVTIKKFHPLVPFAAYLLAPYLFWVSFAAILNLSIFILNP